MLLFYRLSIDLRLFLLAIAFAALGLSACTPAETTGDNPVECEVGEQRSTGESCGLNDRGEMIETCADGEWNTAAACEDSDACTDGELRAQSVLCAADTGRADENCIDGAWVVSDTCVIPPPCVENETRIDSLSCGFNGAGLVGEKCVSATWVIDGSCDDPDVCTNDNSQSDEDICGIFGGGDTTQTCSGGQWGVASACVDPTYVGLLKDINTNTSQASSAPTGFTEFGGKIYYAAADSEHGRELWVSDGTPGGTQLFMDIFPGVGSSSPAYITAAGSLLYFTVLNSSGRYEIWKSDGTVDGTTMVADGLRPQSPSSGRKITMAIGDKFIIEANDELIGREPWVVDGLAGTKTLLAEIYAGQYNHSYFAKIGTLNGFAYFAGKGDFNTGFQLWKSNGTSGGTSMFADINPWHAADYGYVSSSALVTGGMIFGGEDNQTGDAGIWFTDGSTATLIKAINPTVASQARQFITAPDGIVYFFSGDTAFDLGLWKTDGTDGTGGNMGTVLINELIGNTLDVEMGGFAGGKLIFREKTGEFGSEIWSSDGTPQGTEILLIIAVVDIVSNPRQFIQGDDVVYFSATGSDGGRALWATNGESIGTSIFKDGVDGYSSSYASYHGWLGTTLVMGLSSDVGAEAWSSDGTAEGTAILLDGISATLSSLGSFYSEDSFTSFGGKIFFPVRDGRNAGQIFYPEAIWSSDGTTEGTVEAFDLPFPLRTGASSTHLFVLQNVLTPPSGNYLELWGGDGTQANSISLGQLAVTGDLVGAGDRIFFGVNDAGGIGSELWTSDGTLIGTKLVKDIYADAPSGLPGNQFFIPLNINGTWKVLFPATTLDEGTEFWISDGTEAGTTLLKDINVGTDNTANYSFEPVASPSGDKAFFYTATAAEGAEPWITDGTEAGTIMLGDLNADTANSRAYGPEHEAVAYDGGWFFIANNGVDGTELWNTDGTPEGTAMVTDLTGDSTSTSFSELVMVGNTLFFLTGDGIIWSSDGTAEGTQPLYTQSTLNAPFMPKHLVSVGGRLVFSAGQEQPKSLWLSDGTSEGTVVLSTIETAGDPTGGFGDFSDIMDATAVVGTTLFFSAHTDGIGGEPWVLRTH